jgi:peptidoglycan/LPS O-acetylase OafA/YrhL
MTAKPPPSIRSQQAVTAAPGAFDGLRLVAALAVLFTHCYALLGLEQLEPLARLTNGSTTFSELGLLTFFAISGYLVTQSWFRDPSIWRFFMRRSLRIIPGLAFVIFLSFAIIGPLLTTLDVADYFSRREAWGYLAKILVFPSQYGLPGVFADNPFPIVVNGSLWSLRVEVVLYFAVSALSVVRLAGAPWTVLVAAACCLGIYVVLTGTDGARQILFFHQAVALFSNAVPFFVGATLAVTTLASGRLRLVAATLTGLTLVLASTPAFKPLLLLALPVVVIQIGREGRCDLSRLGDYSYGLYLWGFVVEQTIVNYVPTLAPITLFFAAVGPAFVMAAFSWHLVEKRALRCKPSRASWHIKEPSTVRPA